MKQNTSNSAKKGARRGAGQAVAAMVMALAVAVGGVGTTALLAAQPVGLTVEPSTIQWEDDSTQTSTHQNQKKQEQKKPTVKVESEAATEQPAESKAESTAASVEEKAGSAAPSVSEAASSEAAPSEPAQEPAPADPMAGDGTGLEQENAFPVFQQETDELAAEDPLSPRVENTAMDGAADTAVSTAGINSVEDALAEAQIKDENGTILLTPEEIRAALDAGTLDEDSIDAQCLADENGLLSWLWKWLFGKKEDNTPAPVYSGWRTVNGKTYYYDQNTNKPVTGIQSIDNKLYYFDAEGVQQSAKFGIDVSKYQSNIDFEKAKKAGVEFVIIRIGYRGYGSGTLVLDPMFEQHFTNARNAGLKVGVYFFSQAVNENEAREEAQGCWYVLNSRKLDYPIYFDSEASGGSNGRADGLGVTDRTKCAIAFCEEVKALGYQPGVYASTLWFRNRLDLSQLSQYPIWNAHYNVTIQAKILELIRSIQKERGISVIYITHDLGVVAKVADYVDVMYAGKIVETGTIDEIFYEPRHPYTWGLLSAMPDLDTADDRLYTIPGSPPNLLHEKPGDAFAPRNHFALNIDDEVDPPMFKITDTHYAATWLLDPRAPKVDMPPELAQRIARMKAEAKKIEEAE